MTEDHPRGNFKLESIRDSTILTLTWYREGSLLPEGSVIPAKLTLAAAAEIGKVTSYDFDITVKGST